ncbi:MAG TPA: YARHG domain-containing protein [Pyrinomonadaceae bacterium]|nr:YARHG domain-containing protein [Pyrinomonadaceae bacterium]
MTPVPRQVRPAFFLCALFLAFSSFTTQAQDRLDEWKDFDFRNSTLKQAEVQTLEMYDLKLLRGLVFGRHGRVFKDAEIKSFLETKSWYKPNAEFTNSMLNETERRNLDLIRIAEAAKHATIQPGDMRYWRDRAIPAKKLGQHSGAEWKVLVAEVEAIHGKRFDDDPWLRQYFEERYWYFPSDKYDAKKLSAIERKNLQLLSGAQKKQRRVALLPGDMEFFENRKISEQMLHGLSLHELRLLRNEIYARHGRMFRADWLQQYFYVQPWYNPDENFKDEDLSGTDKLNVETIVRYENRLHEELSTKPITRALLEGLFIEDASQMRQEIYARHGKVFKEPWLQKYFSSFAWYKADPEFNEANLTEVEKKNIATIAAYEKRAVTAMSTIEG